MTETIHIGSASEKPLSPFVFGHNLEHTRAAVGGGLSAQMLRNRKFAGKPSRNRGVAAEWEGIGEKAFFQLQSKDGYTRHEGCEGMRRMNELQCQSVQNVYGGLCGIAQGKLPVTRGQKYELRAAVRCACGTTLTAELTDAAGGRVYARKELALTPGDWQVSEFDLTAAESDDAAVLRFSFTERTEVVFGAVSMMAEGHFRGMRADAVRCLKEIGPAILRWPGGNFAGEYRWKDGLLPCDMRGPLQAATEIETQPYSCGYDFHEISTDDFMALCREVGAEPFLTINLAWNSPEESAEWVEYCNGSPDTRWGGIRAARGHAEPYRVKYWSLGNEMGYGHMEGPMKPADYALLAARHAEAMRRVSPDIELFSSGPYPNEDWAEHSAAALAPAARYASLHYYANVPMAYWTEEKTEETYRGLVSKAEEARAHMRKMRECLDRTGRDILISFDEWNVWYSWMRPSCAGEGIFTAKMLHMLLAESEKARMPVCCYFQPVGEGCVLIDAHSARLTANGQVFALMKAHCGGRLCRIAGGEEGSVLATEKDGARVVTLINDSFDREKEFALSCAGAPEEGTLLSAEAVTPYTFFASSELKWETKDTAVRVTLPPHSVGRIRMRV